VACRRSNPRLLSAQATAKVQGGTCHSASLNNPLGPAKPPGQRKIVSGKLVVLRPSSTKMSQKATPAQDGGNVGARNFPQRGQKPAVRVGQRKKKHATAQTAESGVINTMATNKKNPQTQPGKKGELSIGAHLMPGAKTIRSRNP